MKDPGGFAIPPGSCRGGAGGSRTHTGDHPNGFSYYHGFRHSRQVVVSFSEICSLDFPLTVAFRLRSRPSSLYTFFLLPR
jgi:hypothetical protein